MPVVVTQVITQVPRILKNGRTCEKGPLKGGFLQVWQQKCPKTGFLLPYLQRIWATEPVVTGMAGLELGQVHVALLGQGLVEGKGFVEGVAGLTLLGYLEVIPHELLVVGVHAVLDDALGALGG